MIKLVELLKLNEMVYSDKVTPNHKEKINMNTEIISNDVLIPSWPFPENSSRKTRQELSWLIEYNDRKIDKKFVKDGDDVIKVFEDYCKDNNLEFNKKYYKKIMKESSKFILKLKYQYNRPRPYQLGEYYDILDFKIHNLDSAKTPSYPSGHTTQGCLIGELLGKDYPNHYEEFKKLSNFISESRLMARAHYPSEMKFGEEIAMYLLGGIHD